MVFKKHKFYRFFSEMTKRQKSIEVKCFCRNFTPTIDKEPIITHDFSYFIVKK